MTRISTEGQGYKKKLPSKYFQERITNKERFSDALNAQRWRFLKSGLDDFRNGCPRSSDNIIIHGKRGPIPIIVHYKNTDHSQIVPYKTREQQNKSKVVCSKLSAAQKTKKDFIAQTERCLNQHPLALYPHLEESMPKELFRDVMRLLDPEMDLTRVSPDESKSEVNIPVPHELHCETPPEISYSPPVLPWLPKKKNPYTWFSKQEVAERERAAKIAYVPPLDENVKRVTKEFCEWVSAMGGEKYNIDEATVMKLFDTSYETTAKSVAPIKIVELYHVPPELRECPEGIPCRKSIQSPDMRTASEPKWEKIKYGAWYLHPKKWKKKRVGEQDEIPESLKAFLKLRKKKAQKGEGEEMPLHGTYAFEKFLDAKGYRKPAFLLQMLAACNSDKAVEESGHSSRRLSVKVLEGFKSRSSSII
ncbi:protein FAM47E-like [Varanus komodoensis]|uniref:protein FAM47E-like n=1 Tax=Varanus komodoensis TaxID=61221 RepID=UPI001CF7EC7F|nr:protein FAM47E-like [Varanus komodoensis]